MSIIVWLITGGIAGYLASLVMGADAKMGIIANVVVGIIGAFVGGFIITLFGPGEATFNNAITGLNITSILVALIGAVVLLGVLRLFNKSYT